MPPGSGLSLWDARYDADRQIDSKLTLCQLTDMKHVSDMPRTDSGEEAKRLLAEVSRLHSALLAAADHMARPYGLTAARWDVLAAVRDEPRTVSGVARLLGLTRQSVQRSVARLEADGFVHLADNPHHRRSMLVVPTDSGAKTLAALAGERARWLDAAAHGLEPVNLRMATGLVRGLAKGAARLDAPE